MKDRTGELVEEAKKEMNLSTGNADLLSKIEQLQKSIDLLRDEVTLIVSAIDQHNQRLEAMEGE